jgi:hypothetical protein
MQYIIRAFDVNNGQITVEYDGKWTYAVDLPIEEGAFPIGERLEEIIQSMAPVWLAERQNSLATTPANVDAIQTLVQPYPTPEATELSIHEQTEFQQNQLESDTNFITQIVNDILASKGL